MNGLRNLPSALWIIVATFVVMCCVFNAKTPYRQPGVLIYQTNPETGERQTALDIGAPDERQHANYIAGLKKGEGFKKIVPGDPNLYEYYQAHQPPLYYLLATGWSFATGADPADASGGFRVRFLNTLIGALTLIGTFFCARWGLKRDDIGLTAAAFVGLLPMSVALHSAVSNDPLLYCICAWTLAFVLRGANEGWTKQTVIWISVLIGLGLLTKTNAIALIPVTLLGMMLSMKKEEHRPNPVHWGLVLVVPLVIASPWLMRNMNLYGDPFALSVFQDAFTGNPKASLFIQAFGAQTYWLNFVMWWTTRSFVGAFGYMDIFIFESTPGASAPFYTAVILIITVICAVGLVGPGKTESEVDQPIDRKTFHLISGVLFLLTLFFFMRFNSEYFQGQARYLFPALASFGLAFACGMSVILKDKRANGWVVCAVFMLILDVLALMAINQGFPLRITS
ncbi:MAG: glycosyltransferase family 39 protein [Armatimonadetes bacterium]|nr:glycosyltransferase family 39 protein [Armatimonadota bacterium]